MKKILFCLLTLSLTFGIAQEKYHRTKVHYKNGDIFMKLMEMGVPMDHGEHEKGYVFTSDFSDKQINIIKSLGLDYEIIIDDIEQYYLDQNDPTSSRYISEASVRKLNEYDCDNGTSGKDKYPTPKNFNQGSMGGYLTYTEMLQELDDMYQYCQDNGIDIITKRADNIDPNDPDDLKTFEGRYQQWVKISDNANKDESGTEPQMLYTSIHHAREAMSLQQLIFYMWYLVENYKTNPEIKSLIDNTEIFFIPCLNPDGYIYNETKKPEGGGMWRKNRRDGHGVDNNRNYSYIAPDGKEMWNTAGTSNNKNNDTYAGTGPFSEPENRAMRYFIENHNFEIAINNHTYSDLVLLPFGYDYEKPSPDHDLFMALSDEMVKENGYKNQISSELYPAAGNSDDFIYGNLTTKNGGTRKKVFSMTPEIGGQDDNGFWPPKAKIELMCKEMMHLNLTALRAARNYAVITDNSSYTAEKTTYPVKFSLKRIGVKEPANFKISLEAVSNNIESVGTTKEFKDLKFNEVQNGEIVINLKSSIQDGENFTFKIHNDNGQYITTETITRIFGKQQIAFEDDADTLEKWDSNTWKTTTNEYKTSPKSITDSPNGKYKNNSKTYITLKDAEMFDLTNDKLTDAVLTFYAKWDIEKGYDYVQVEASTGDDNWTPLCGNYTKSGGKKQKDAENEPVYDGVQKNWVKEQINLNDYLGEKVKIRFSLITDRGTSADGFYFDDVVVSTLGGNLSVVDNDIDKFINIYPNPVKDNLTISTTLKNYSYTLSNITGQLLLNSSSNTGSKTINYNNFSQGVYLLQITTEEGKERTYKIIKQ